MIILKTQRELELLYESNQIVAEALQELKNHIAVGITTAELDMLAYDFITKKGAIPAFKGYKGYPASLCISLNEEIVHGIPGSRKLKEGDIVSLDLGALQGGYYGDAAITVPVGKIKPKAHKLLEVTEEALNIGVQLARVGNRLADISRAIQSFVEGHGFSVVRDFVGHGIGKNLHEDPQIPNFYSPASHNPRFREGMVFALEPMVNEGTHEITILHDGWTAVTADKKLSAHFEHTIAVTKDGPWVLSSFEPTKASMNLVG